MDENLKDQTEQAKQEMAPAPRPQTTQPAIIAAPAESRLPTKLQAALLIFTLTSGAAAALLPNLSKAFGVGDQPTVFQLAITGLVIIGLTTILLSYAAKVIGLGKAWFLLAVIYNAAIIIIKFVISPSSLYGRTFIEGSEPFSSDNPVGNILVGLLVVLLYVAVFRIIYSIYNKKLKKSLGFEAVITDVAKHYLSIGFKVFLGGALLVGVGASGLLFLPLIFFGNGLTYLTSAFAGAGIALLIAIGVAIFSAIEAYDRATTTSVEMRDASVLATFFWLGFSLILIYHVLWVIYMTVVVSIWPLKTVSPSGK